nr:hydrogenase maturation nickel metallochaperone HypA [Pirellula sp.]
GVEQILLADALELLAQKEGRVDVDIIFNEVPLLARCEDCLTDFPIVDFLFTCVNCGGKRLRMIDGDSIRLLHLDLQSAQKDRQLV